MTTRRVSPGRRREVVVNGRRAKTVDVHAHCAVPEALALMNLKLGDRFPGLKICGAHAGGYLPSYLGRSDRGCPTRPVACPGGGYGPIKRKPSEYLKEMYYDTMVFSGEGVRHLAAEVGAGQRIRGRPARWTTSSPRRASATPTRWPCWAATR